MATWSQGYRFAACVPKAGPAFSLGPGERDFLQQDSQSSFQLCLNSLTLHLDSNGMIKGYNSEK